MVFIRRSKVVPLSLSLSRLGGLIIVNFTDVLIGYNRLQNKHTSSYTELSFSKIKYTSVVLPDIQLSMKS